MGDVNYININGSEFNFLSSEQSIVKVYNNSELRILAYDIFIETNNYDSYIWLMTKVPNQYGNYVPKLTLTFDEGNERVRNIFGICGGLPGDCISNPIIYKRTSYKTSMSAGVPTFGSVPNPEFTFWSSDQDYLTVKISALSDIPKDDLANNLRNAILVIQPSDHLDFDDTYLYSDEKQIGITQVGLTYKY